MEADDDVHLSTEHIEAPRQWHNGARLVAVATCLVAAAALGAAAGSVRRPVAPSTGVVSGISLADAAEASGYVRGVLDSVYRKRNASAASLKTAVEENDWKATARYAHEYDKLNEHARVLEDWQWKVSQVYDAIQGGAYEMSGILLDEAKLVGCMAKNKADVLDVERKLEEVVEPGDAQGIDKADVFISVLEEMQDECVKRVDGEATSEGEAHEQVNGTMTFSSGGSAAVVERAVSVVLGKQLGTKPSQVIVVARAAPHPSGSAASGSGSERTTWDVAFSIVVPGPAPADEGADTSEEVKATVKAVANSRAAVREQLGWVLPYLEPDSFKLTLPPPPRTGRITFSSGGSQADVEGAVSASLVSLLELEGRQVAVTVVGARRLAAKAEPANASTAAANVSGGEPEPGHMPWVVTFTLTVPDRLALKAVDSKLSGISDDPSAMIQKLNETLPDLDPETFQVALPVEGDDQVPAFTSTSGAPTLCSAISENCRWSQCCSEPDTYCYEKNEYWAGCRPSCNVGVHEQDPEGFRENWTCTLLGSNPGAPAPVETPQPSVPDCSGIGENCMQSRCCADPGYYCYRRDEHRASCRPSCSVGVHQCDPPADRAPWSCDKLDKKASSQPDPTRENCSASTSSCLETRCCQDADRFCYRKNDWWAGCLPRCDVGVHEHDPRGHRTPWTCEVLDVSSAAPAPIPAPEIPTEIEVDVRLLPDTGAVATGAAVA